MPQRPPPPAPSGEEPTSAPAPEDAALVTPGTTSKGGRRSSSRRRRLRLSGRTTADIDNEGAPPGPWRLAFFGVAAALLCLWLGYRAGHKAAVKGRPLATAPSSPAAAALRGYPARPMTKLFHEPEFTYLRRYQNVFKNRAVNNTIMFTVVGLRERDGKPSTYTPMIRNWDINVRKAVPAFGEKRLIIGEDAHTCEQLAAAGVYGCVADDFTAWNGKGRDPFVRLKWHWAYMALSLGYEVFFADNDVYFLGEFKDSNPVIEYLTTGARARGGGRMPDMQMLSDLQYNVPYTRTCRGESEGRDVAELLVSTGLSWLNNTADTWYTRHGLTCADCPVHHMYWQAGFEDTCSCMSTGFWYVVPTAPSLRLFQLMHEQMAGDPGMWEQRLLNLLVAQLFPPPDADPTDEATYTYLPRIAVLDPRAIGNAIGYDCTARFPELMNPLSNPHPQRLVVHPGYYNDWVDKVKTAKDHGVWFVEEA